MKFKVNKSFRMRILSKLFNKEEKGRFPSKQKKKQKNSKKVQNYLDTNVKNYSTKCLKNS
jgi:hypothetical protein